MRDVSQKATCLLTAVVLWLMPLLGAANPYRGMGQTDGIPGHAMMRIFTATSQETAHYPCEKHKHSQSCKCAHLCSASPSSHVTSTVINTVGILGPLSSPILIPLNPILSTQVILPTATHPPQLV